MSTQEIQELRDRLAALEDKVSRVAAPIVKEPPPPPRHRVICLGVAARDPESPARVSLRTAIVREGKLEVPNQVSEIDIRPGAGKLVVHGGRQNDVTHENVDYLRLLFENKAQFQWVTDGTQGGNRSAQPIASLQELERAIRQAREGAPV